MGHSRTRAMTLVMPVCTVGTILQILQTSLNTSFHLN